MELKDAALKYAQNGYRVLPVWWIENGKCACGDAECRNGGTKEHNQGKHPIKPAWQKLATLDEARISRWWQTYPKASIGIMPPVGTILLDVDPRKGGANTLKAMVGTHKLPSTVVQKSGGSDGGMHILFKGDIPGGKLGEGIDLRRHGKSFVVAWPSRHISGRQYAWIKAPWEVKAAALPSYLGSGSQNEQKSAVAPEFGPVGEDETAVGLDAVRPMLETLEYWDSSDRDQWVKVGQALKHSYGDDAKELWVEWSQLSPDHDFNDSDDELWERSFDKNPGVKPITVKSIVSIARKRGYRGPVTEFDGGIWQRGDIRGFITTAPEPIEWVFEGIVPCGRVTVMAGAGGSSKSFLSLILAVMFAMQQTFGAFKPGCAGKVVILTAEDDRGDIHRRVHAICKNLGCKKADIEAIENNLAVVSTRGEEWHMVFSDDAGELRETKKVKYITEQLSALGDVKMLVIDPLVAFNGGNENDNAEMSKLMFLFDRIAKATKAAVMIIHHASKSGGNVSLEDMAQSIVRGASALVDNARSAMLLVRLPRKDAPLFGIAPDDSGRYLVVRFIKNNYGPHLPDAIFSVESGGALRYAPEVQKVHHNRTEAEKSLRDADTRTAILQAIPENEFITVRELTEAVGVTTRTIQRYLEEMKDSSLMYSVGGARGPGISYKLTKKGVTERDKKTKKRSSAADDFNEKD